MASGLVVVGAFLCFQAMPFKIKITHKQQNEAIQQISELLRAGRFQQAEDCAYKNGLGEMFAGFWHEDQD